MSNDVASNKAHGQPDSVSGQASEAFKESSVCAVSTILSTDNKPRKIFRSVVFVLFTLAFFYQFIAFLCYVVQYPTIIEHEILRPEEFVSPAYTFCNFNPIKRSKFCERYPDNCTRPDKEFCEENPRFCGTPETEILKDIITGIDRSDEQYELSYDAEDMVEIEDEEEDNPVGPLPRKTDDSGVTACFSYFDRVDSPLDPVMQKRTPIATGVSNWFRFDPQENEVLYPEWKSGIMFDVHSPFEAANPFSTGFFMRPGHRYRIMVKMTQEELLPNDCFNYTEMWLKNGKKGYRSQAACRYKCFGDIMVKCYNCIFPQILYPYPNVNVCQRNPDVSPLKECENPEDVMLECLSQCKDDCLKLRYSYEVEEIFANRYALQSDRNASRKIGVVVEFPNADIQKIVQKPRFQVLEAFSLIGGLLAFWIGLSMFQVVEVFDCTFQIGKYLFKNRSAKPDTSSA